MFSFYVVVWLQRIEFDDKKTALTTQYHRERDDSNALIEALKRKPIYDFLALLTDSEDSPESDGGEGEDAVDEEEELADA